jgi:hypothetical protein
LKVALVKPLLCAFVARDLLQDRNRRRREFVAQEAVDDGFIDEIESIRGQYDRGVSGVEFVHTMEEDRVLAEVPFLRAGGVSG